MCILAANIMSKLKPVFENEELLTLLSVNPLVHLDMSIDVPNFTFIF